MRAAPEALVTQAVALAAELPPDLVGALAEAIASCDVGDWRYARREMLQLTPQPRFRALVEALLEAWRDHAPDLDPGSVALALRAAAAAAQHCRGEQSVELVWTGPGAVDVPLRRTDQALLQVIEAAQRALLVVSFAVYEIPAVTQALIRAFERGVFLRVCVEAPEPSGRRMAYDTIEALGRDVQQRAAIYIWPQEKRLAGSGGRTGSLHTKCAVADRQALFVSSANLTGHAMTLNMELGVLIRGGPLPGQVVTHFERLIERGVLERVDVGER
jgi:cardiolipin synthase